MFKFLVALTAGTLTLMLASTALASAPGQRGFADTFPVASPLCVRAQDNQLPPRLRANTSALLTACATLHSSFTAAVLAADTRLSVLKAQKVADTAQFRVKLRAATAARAAALTAALAQRKVALAKARADRSQSEAQAARAAFRATLTTVRSSYLGALKAARDLLLSQAAGLRASVHMTRTSYVVAVEAARKTFWAEVARLRAPATTTV